MDETLFTIESWRGMWFYKCGSRYTGPFTRRSQAEAAAQHELSRVFGTENNGNGSSDHQATRSAPRSSGRPHLILHTIA